MRYKVLYNEEVFDGLAFEEMAPISDREYDIIRAEDTLYRSDEELKIIHKVLAKASNKIDELDISITYFEEFNAVKIIVENRRTFHTKAYALVPENSPFFNIDLLADSYDLLDRVRGNDIQLVKSDMKQFTIEMQDI